MSKMSDKFIDMLNKELDHAPIILQPGEVWIPGQKLQIPKDQVMMSEESDVKPEHCFHVWETKTMFRFDTTYCKKCGKLKEEK